MNAQRAAAQHVFAPIPTLLAWKYEGDATDGNGKPRAGEQLAYPGDECNEDSLGPGKIQRLDGSAVVLMFTEGGEGATAIKQLSRQSMTMRCIASSHLQVARARRVRCECSDPDSQSFCEFGWLG